MAEAITLPNGVQLIKWTRQEEPTAETVAAEMAAFGYGVYDLQTVPRGFAAAGTPTTSPRSGRRRGGHLSLR
ncbi:MAG: hypothetical protein R3F43_29085 [bacterium]